MFRISTRPLVESLRAVRLGVDRARPDAAKGGGVLNRTLITAACRTAVEFGLATYHIKPVMLGGLVWGGLLCGFGMAVPGYCPGTLPISAGRGTLEAWVGIAGELVFTLPYPVSLSFLGSDRATISVHGNVGEYSVAVY